MRDLDWSDVLDDADRMRDEYFMRLYNNIAILDDNALRKEIYRLGIEARAGREFSMDALRMAEIELTGRLITTLCEGCWNRTGCDMCCPPDFTDLYGQYNAFDDGHYERFGRPAFPNEY